LGSSRLRDSDESATRKLRGAVGTVTGSVTIVRSGTRGGSRSRSGSRLGRLCAGVVGRSSGRGGRLRVASMGAIVGVSAGLRATLLGRLKLILKLGDVLTGHGESKIGVGRCFAAITNVGNKHIRKRVQVILRAT
jgi:hypothetical protein